MEGISSLLNFLLNLIWRYLHCFIHVMLYIERLIWFAWQFICIFNCTTTNPDTVMKISAIVSTVVVWCGLAALWQEGWPRKKHRISTLSGRSWVKGLLSRVPSFMRTYVWVLIILWFCVIHLCDEDSFIIHMISDDEQITVFLHTLDMMLLTESWLINSLS